MVELAVMFLWATKVAISVVGCVFVGCVVVGKVTKMRKDVVGDKKSKNENELAFGLAAWRSPIHIHTFGTTVRTLHTTYVPTATYEVLYYTQEEESSLVSTY